MGGVRRVHFAGALALIGLTAGQTHCIGSSGTRSADAGRSDAGFDDGGSDDAALKDASPGCAACTILDKLDKPTSLRLEGDSLYFKEGCYGSIGSVPVAGGDKRSLVPGGERIEGMGVYAGVVYFSTPTQVLKLAGPTTPVQFAASPPSRMPTDDLLADKKGVFWSTLDPASLGTDGIASCPLNDCTAPSYAALNQGSGYSSLMSDDAAIYGVTVNTFSSIVRVAVGGDTKVLGNVNNVAAIAVDSGPDLYLVRNENGATLLERVNKTAGGVRGGLGNFPGDATSVALDGAFVYVATGGTDAKEHADGHIFRIKKDGTGRAELATDLKNPHDLVVGPDAIIG